MTGSAPGFTAASGGEGGVGSGQGLASAVALRNTAERRGRPLSPSPRCAPMINDPSVVLTPGAGARERRLYLAASTLEARAEDWLILGVLACERKLCPSVLAKASSRPLSRALLDRWFRAGILLDAGVAQSFALAQRFEPERAVAVAPPYRPWILLELAERGGLEAVSETGRASIGDGSLCPFMTSLYSGELSVLQREQQALLYRSARGEVAFFVRERLREAVLALLEGQMLEPIWKQGAASLVEQVLSDALPCLGEVEALYQWALDAAPPGQNPDVDALLAEHALLRGDVSTCRQREASLSALDRLGLRAAIAYEEGELARADQLLEEILESKGGQEPVSLASVAVVLALLALRRRPFPGSIARRLLPQGSREARLGIARWPSAEGRTEVAKALRLLFKRSGQPETERRRMSAHQVLAQSPCWATLIMGLTVQLQDREAVNRTAWARRLVDLGTRSRDAGYSWFARQTLHVARALSPDPLPELAPLEPCLPGEQLICNLIEPEPEWRRALESLATFVKTVERGEQVVSRRVAWYVDMAHGELARPALEEFVSERGWTRERRVTMAELRSLGESLPPEDAAVVKAAVAENAFSGPPLEVFEALIGHPRVFNGVRGRTPVEVVRGTCRIEIRHDHGHLVVQVEPGRAREGVNLVFEGEARIIVYRVSRIVARLIDLVPNGIRIPESEQHHALPILAHLAEHIDIESPVFGGRRTIEADSSPCLRISSEAGAWWVELGVRPFGEGGRFFPPGVGRVEITSHDGEALISVQRGLELELERSRELLSRCPTLQAGFIANDGDGLCVASRAGSLAGVSDSNAERGADEVSVHEGRNAAGRARVGCALSEDALLGMLAELRSSGLPCFVEWRNSRPIAYRGTLTTGAIHGVLRRVKGWYLVTGGVAIDDVTTSSLAELVSLPFTKSGRFVRLPSGDFLEVEERVRQFLRTLASVAVRSRRTPTDELGVPEAALSVVSGLLDSENGLTIDASASEHRSFVQSTLASEPSVPEGLGTELRPYQLEGFRWMSRRSRLELGVCLADDMGLGKTVQVLAVLLERAAGGPALVVAPTSVCHNWVLELRRFAPSLQVFEYWGRARGRALEACCGPDRAASRCILIASYALLQQDAKQLQAIEWHTAVLDEAQVIKNPSSLRAKAAFALRARFRVALTGTPVENHLGDLWSIFHFVCPSLLGSWKQFRLRYLKPTNEAHIDQQRAALRQLVQPLLLRRRKDEVLRELPAVTTLRHTVTLPPDDAIRYALLRRRIHDKLRTSHGKREHKLQVLAELTRLRRFCCHPRLVFPDAASESAKIEAFLELAVELRESGHRALVFSQFVDFLQLVRERLDECGFRYLYLDGSTPKEMRPGLVREFQEGDVELFLISLKAGGFGLNLTAADYVIHLDPWWNPAIESQATDRAHRIGQTRPVTACRLVTLGTIEESILALHEEKRAIAGALLDESDIPSEFDTEALMALLESEPSGGPC